MTRSHSRLLTLFVVAVLGLIPVTPVIADTTHSHHASSTVVQDWERTSILTIYGDPELAPKTPIAIGVPYLGYTSLAMYRAAQAADRQHGSRVAAIAVAAHDVLLHYFPESEKALDGQLDVSLGTVAAGPSKERGRAAGARAAARMILSRADDGPDPSIVYDRDEDPGVWQPAPGGAMLAPWLGFIDPLVVRGPVRAKGVNGPDALTSSTYARQYNEVKRLGAATGSARTDRQTDTAQFFNSNSAIMLTEGLLRYLDRRPMGLMDTVRLLATIHSSMTDSLITCWRLKYEVGFWRPFQAIHGAGSDGNLATVPDPAWQPLIANPPYSDYVSGHGCVTAPAIETIRHTLGERTALTLHSYSTDTERRYKNLSSIERDAFHARIWGGLHFRTAMNDAYAIGHATADKVLRKLGH
ncbi:vanadium-dependent haloperoxidase [Nakamurella sp. GG22]